MKTRYLFFFSLLASLCLLASCSKSDDDSPQAPTVIEKIEPFVDYVSPEINVSASAQTVEILTKTNAKWAAHIYYGDNDENWIVNPSFQTDGENMIIRFDVTENKGDSPREGYFALKLQERESRWWYYENEGMPTFIITQAAANP